MLYAYLCMYAIQLFVHNNYIPLLYVIFISAYLIDEDKRNKAPESSHVWNNISIVH